jgi:thioredoxin-related protein
MKSAEVDTVMFEYFTNKAEHYLYAPNSPYRNDEYYIPFLEYLVNTPILDNTYKIRPQYLLNLACKNRPGEKALDFQYTTANGKQGNLYGIKSEYLLFMFYNPGCNECRNTMKMIQESAEIAPLINNRTIKVLAFYADENIEKWKEYVEEVPSNWLNGYDKSLTIREKELYDVKAIPTLYFLDKDKKVILKDCSVDNINEFLKKLKGAI